MGPAPGDVWEMGAPAHMGQTVMGGKEPGRRPSGLPTAYSPLTSLPRIPLACFTVAFRQNTGFWRDRGGEPEAQRDLGFPVPSLPRMALNLGYLKLPDLLEHLLVFLGLHVEGLVGRSLGGSGHRPGMVARQGRRTPESRLQGRWGLGSPPAGTAAVQRPRSHGWAQVFLGGAGLCRGLPRRAGPAET